MLKHFVRILDKIKKEGGVILEVAYHLHLVDVELVYLVAHSA